jgi:hypothetical protein
MDTGALPLRLALNVAGAEASVRFKTGRQGKMLFVQIQFNFPRNHILGSGAMEDIAPGVFGCETLAGSGRMTLSKRGPKALVDF